LARIVQIVTRKAGAAITSLSIAVMIISDLFFSKFDLKWEIPVYLSS
jgi:hypothetical protein